jgi:hypothetical protein
MEPISFITPILKGFLSTAGATLVAGSTGYIVYKKFIIDHPLTEYLEEVTDKKFSKKSLVSHTIQGKGVSEYRYKIPAGQSVEDMLKLKPGIEDKFDCEIQVWAEETNFVVQMSVNPIPKSISFDKRKVKDVLSPYECAMYLGESRLGPVVIDFTDNKTPHLLFGGPTGGGKSNLLNQGICGMTHTYTPEQLNYILIDLKDGVELGVYKNLPHTKAFCETVTQVEARLSLLLEELKKRNKLFKKNKVKNLTQYNGLGHSPLPRVVIIADEFAQFNNNSDKEQKKKVFKQWEEILQKGRSTGIHVIIGTQVADADVFPTQIKGNIDPRFGFKFSDVQHSKMITGGGELKYLPNIVGRGLFKLGTLMVQTQVPYIGETNLMDIVEKYSVEKEWEDEETHEEELVEESEVTDEAESVEESSENVRESNPIENLFMDEEDFKKQQAVPQ